LALLRTNIHKTVHASVGGFVVWGHGLMQRRDLLPVDVGEVGSFPPVATVLRDWGWT
jgi:hypothetical protein